MLDSRDTWDIIYIAWSNTCHPPFSPNIAPATQKTLMLDPCHTWNIIYIHCAEQQYSPCNVTKNCTCHEKWLASLILIAYETLCTPRGATEAPLQHHQILCPPRKMTLQNLKEIYWEKLKRHFTARGRSKTVPTMIREWTQPAAQLRLAFALRLSFQISPGTVPARKLAVDIRQNTAPATKSDSHDGSSSFLLLLRHLQCAEQQKSPSQFTKYWACHEKWLSWWIFVTKEMSFAMRGATEVTLSIHEILSLPRKITRMIDPPHIWNVIYNVRSNRNHPPKSPNTAPKAQKKDCPKSNKFGEKDWNVIYIARPIRDCSNHDPRMIRP